MGYLRWQAVAVGGFVGVLLSGVVGFVVGAAVGSSEGFELGIIAGNLLSLVVAGVVAGRMVEGNEMVHGLLAGIATVVISQPINMALGLGLSLPAFLAPGSWGWCWEL